MENIYQKGFRSIQSDHPRSIGLWKLYCELNFLYNSLPKFIHFSHDCIGRATFCQQSFVALKFFRKASLGISVVTEESQTKTAYWLLFPEYLEHRNFFSTIPSPTFLTRFLKTLWGQSVGTKVKKKSMSSISCAHKILLISMFQSLVQGSGIL